MAKKKQDITVSDATSTARLVLWEDKVNTLDEDACYALHDVVVHHFRDQKYLSLAKTGSTIQPIDDIGDVVPYDPEIDEDNQRCEICNAIIAAVVSLDTYKACISCKARVEATNASIGACSKCSMMQRINSCNDQLSAKLILEDDNGHATMLSVFGSMLQQMASIIKPTEVMQEALLKSPQIGLITLQQEQNNHWRFQGIHCLKNNHFKNNSRVEHNLTLQC